MATLLMTKKEGVKVVQELMRHANSKITLDVYAQGDEVATLFPVALDELVP